MEIEKILHYLGGFKDLGNRAYSNIKKYMDLLTQSICTDNKKFVGILIATYLAGIMTANLLKPDYVRYAGVTGNKSRVLTHTLFLNDKKYRLVDKPNNGYVISENYHKLNLNDFDSVHVSYFKEGQWIFVKRDRWGILRGLPSKAEMKNLESVLQDKKLQEQMRVAQENFFTNP